MGKAILLAMSALAALVHASSSNCPQEFSYHGCAVVDLNSLGNPLVFSDTILSPEACKKACQGHQLAALFPDCCRCGDQLEAVQKVEDTVCDFACMNDPSVGMCGSKCEPNVSSVYTRTPPGQAAPPNPVNSGVPVSPKDPGTVDQDNGFPSGNQEPSNPRLPLDPGDQSTSGDSHGHGIPPNPKSVNSNPGSTAPVNVGAWHPGPNMNTPDKNGPQDTPPNEQPPWGLPKNPQPSPLEPEPEPESPNPTISPPPTQPEPTNMNGDTPHPGNWPLGEAPEPLSSYPPQSDDSGPQTGSPPAHSEGPDTANTPGSPQVGDPAQPNKGNVTDTGSPPDTKPWPNPSGGLVTEGDPPTPSLVTGSGAAVLGIPPLLTWIHLMAAAVYLS